PTLAHSLRFEVIALGGRCRGPAVAAPAKGALLMRQRQRSSFPCVAGVGLLTLALLAGLPTVAWTAVNPFVATAADASADLSDALLSLRVRSTLLEKLG